MGPKTMRALVLTKAEGASTPTLSLNTDQPVPTPPPGHLLIRVHASAIQPSDILNSRGGFPHTKFPRIPGRDFSGVVVAVGDDTLESTFLDKAVYGTSGSTHAFSEDGFQADYAVVAAESVAAKPKALTHVQAATLGVPFTTAALVVRRSAVQKGETVMVIGANGAVGKAACVLVADLGCRILRAVRGPGGDVDTAADPELQTVRQPVDAVIDTVGLPALTRAAVDNALGQGGRIVIISAPKTDPTADLALRMRDFYRAEKSLLGINTVAHSSSEMAALLRQMDGLFESGKWEQATGTWTEVSLEEATTAYASQERNKKYVIKLV